MQCTECSLWFSTKSNCDRHLLRKHGVATPDAAQETPDQQQSYTLRNTPERPFKCNQCSGSSFSSEENLSKHKLERHTNQQQPELEVAPAKTQNIKQVEMRKKKCANLMDKINRLAGSKSGKQQQSEDTDEAEAAVAPPATAAGIFSEMLGVKPSSIDKLFSSPNSAAAILGLDEKGKDNDQENIN